MTVGKRTQNHALKDCKQRRVCPNAQRECNHRCEGESRIAAQHAQSISQVLKKYFQPSAAANFISFLLDAREMAKPPPGVCAGFLSRHALPDVLPRALLDMES